MSIGIIEKRNNEDFIICDKINMVLGKKGNKNVEKIVNVYDVKSLSNLHQIIGYAKYKYNNYIVLYRGVNEVYPNAMPIAYRDIWNRNKQNLEWKKILNNIKLLTYSKSIRKKLNFDDYHDTWKINLLAESVLQHYGGKTTCLDLVDNVWIALWFGYYKYKEMKNEYYSGRYATYKPPIDNPIKEEYQYIIIFAVEKKINIRQEIEMPDMNFVIDLREILPSIFIRPHAQHAWLLKSNETHMRVENNFANNVIGILRLRSCDVGKWLGNGDLVRTTNLFPNPTGDGGYDALLEWDSNLKANNGFQNGSWNSIIVRYYD